MPKALEDFDLIVLASAKLQLPEYDHPAIYRAPIITGQGDWAGTLLGAVRQVVDALGGGKRALVTCSAGLNRSGAITAIVLQQVLDMSPDESIAAVRSACGEMALRDHNLVKLIRTCRP